jgi:hypothetical protein
VSGRKGYAANGRLAAFSFLALEEEIKAWKNKYRKRVNEEPAITQHKNVAKNRTDHPEGGGVFGRSRNRPGG